MTEVSLLDRAVDTALLDSLFDDIEKEQPRSQNTEFFGELTISSLGPDKFDETALASWHLAVRPLSFELKAATGALHGYEKIKLGKNGKINANSAAGRVIEAIREHTGDNSLKPTSPELIGTVGWFRMEVLEFGKDKKEFNADGTRNEKFGQTIKAGRPSVMMVRAASQEDIDQYVNGNPNVTVATAAFSDEDAESALAVIEGKKPSIYQRGLMRNESLSQAVKTAILNGDMQKFLVASGKAVEEDGVLVRTEGE